MAERNPMPRRLAAAAALLAAALVLLLIPEAASPVPEGAGRVPFVWDRDDLWRGLEGRFVAARKAGCPALTGEIDAGFAVLDAGIAALRAAPPAPNAPEFDALETELFALAPLVAHEIGSVLPQAASATPVVDGGGIRSGLERWGVILAERAEPGNGSPASSSRPARALLFLALGGGMAARTRPGLAAGAAGGVSGPGARGRASRRAAGCRRRSPDPRR